MAKIRGVGSIPNTLDLASVKELFYENMGETGMAQLAMRFAPVVNMGVDEGTYLYRPAGFTGVNLKRNPGQLSEVSLSATNYPDAEVSYEENSFRAKRWQGGRFILEDRRLRKMRRQHGIDVEADVTKYFVESLEAIHTHQVFSALSTAGNYANSYDPGNLTNPDFDLIDALDTLSITLMQQGIGSSVPLDLAAAPRMVSLLQKLNQVKSHYGAPNSNFVATTTQLGAVLSEYMQREVNVHKITSLYYDASGLPQNSMTTGVMAWFHAGQGATDKSLLKTVAPGEEEEGDGEMFSIREERDESIPGTIVYADGYWDMHVGDKNAGVLWTGVNS